MSFVHVKFVINYCGQPGLNSMYKLTMNSKTLINIVSLLILRISHIYDFSVSFAKRAPLKGLLPFIAIIHISINKTESSKLARLKLRASLLLQTYEQFTN
jgi:hypothetical protein